MGEYKFKDKVGKDKVFIVNRNQFNERFDAPFYKEKFDFSNCINLSKLVTVKGGKRIPVGKTYSNKETSNIYFRVSNMENSTDIDYSKVKYISDNLYQFLKRYELFENEIIISIAGTIGKINLIKDFPKGKKVILTENCAKLILKNDKVFPEYLLIVLKSKFVQKQIRLNYIQTTIPKLGLDRVLNLKIPNIPNKENQQKIVNQYQKAYNDKQQKEKEAKEILASIDTYLLNELGITLPVMETELESRVFTVNFSEISGERFDAFAVLNKDYKIEGGKYENFKLRQIAEVQKGQSITSAKIIDGDYPVIAGGQSSPYSHNVYNYENNAITVSASGAYAGFVWYHNTPIFASDCSVIQSKDENNISTLFLSEVLKTKQKEIYNLQQGAGQPHVYSSDLIKLNIPVPSKEKQEEIIKYISEIRTKAKQLKTEAKIGLENAKQEIEKLILGT